VASFSYYLGFSNSATRYNVGDTRPNLGKTSITTVVYDNGTVIIYNNNEIVDSRSVSDSQKFRYVWSNFTNNSLHGRIFYHLIQSTALTPTQVASLHTTLRGLYPEIESVQIGTQTWATRNFEAVATPKGNVIANVTENADWANSTTLYDNAYAAHVGTVAEKEYAGLKAAAMWCYYNNDPDNGATYGKIYNGYGKDLLVDDIALQAGWGYHVATEAELTALAALDGLTLKYSGTDYWTTDNGTNTTGLTALGGASRDTDGTFNTIKATASFWCGDSDKVLTIYDDGTASIEAKDKTFGAYVRLVKD
jgi:hypothetical protein